MDTYAGKIGLWIRKLVTDAQEDVSRNGIGFVVLCLSTYPSPDAYYCTSTKVGISNEVIIGCLFSANPFLVPSRDGHGRPDSAWERLVR